MVQAFTCSLPLVALVNRVYPQEPGLALWIRFAALADRHLAGRGSGECLGFGPVLPGVP